MVPVLKTERLLLRGHEQADHASCLALWGHPEVTRYIGGRPSTSEEVWSRMLRYAGHRQMLGFGYFVVIEQESGALIGEVGLADFRRDLEPRLDVPEAGWVFHPNWHGRGFAHEAVSALLEWGDGRDMGRMACLIDPDNAASLALAGRLGFNERLRTTYHGASCIMLDRPA